jgi:Ca2+-binding RTX toxin-like protein
MAKLLDTTNGNNEDDTDLILNIENIIGTNNLFGDYIIGDTEDNYFQGLMGSDTLYGGLGDDTLDGGLGNDILRADHDKLLLNIINMTKEEITSTVPEATMVSTYIEIKKLFQTKEASKSSFDLEPDVLIEIVEQIKQER